MDLRLNYMAIKNFKGIKDFRLEAQGKSIAVLGDNATYKSSCYDAFCWIVSGKDSFNRADFGIKPLDESGNEIHFLETEVEVELLKDGKPLKLKKVQTENWVKPHGKTEQEYKGNNVAYFFDEVPVGAKAYKDRVEEFIGEEVFRLLTNPLYFNLHYKVGKLTDWQSRRMLLFEMCSEMTDEQIIAANPSLVKLPEVLGGKSIDDRKAIIAQSIKKLNEDIEKICPKINENMRLIPEIEIDYSATESELARLKAILNGIDIELSSAANAANEYRKKQQELYGLKSKLDSIKTRINSETYSERNGLVDEETKLNGEVYRLKADIGGYKTRIDQNKRAIENNSVERQKLLEQWKEHTKAKADAQALQFTEPDEDNFSCPMCGQSLPEEAKESKLAEMREKFDKDKSNRIQWAEEKLTQNKNSGLAIKQSTETLQKSIDNYSVSLNDAVIRLKEIESRIVEIETVLSEPVATPDYSADAEYVSIEKQITSLQSELDKPIEDTTAKARELKQSTVNEIELCNRVLNNRDVVKDAKLRIDELKQSERELSNQKSKLEGQLNLITDLIKAKANTLTDIMNAKFKHVRFRLFDIQQNGGIVEVCDTMVNTNGKWVPYSDGNTAGRINAGIDVINSLAEHYGVNVPIWVDNAESVSLLADTKSQVIRLVKPEIQTDEIKKKYSKLNVEVDGNGEI